MAEPKKNFADLLKKFEPANKTQPQQAATKPAVQSTSTTGKSVNTVQPPTTIPKQPIKEVTAPSPVSSKPAETTSVASNQSTLPKPKVEPEPVTKPAVTSENPKPASAFSQNPFIMKNNANLKPATTTSETNKPSNIFTVNKTQASTEAKPAQEEAKSSPFGNIKPTAPVSTATRAQEQETSSTKPSVSSEISKPVTATTTSHDPSPAAGRDTAEHKEAPAETKPSKPSNIFAASNNKPQEEAKPSPFGATKQTVTSPSTISQNVSSPEKQTSSNKPFGTNPFDAPKQAVTSPTTNPSVTSSTKPAEPEKTVNKTFVTKEFKPIPKEEPVIQAPVVNKVTTADPSGEPKLNFKDRLKMFDKPKSDDSPPAKLLPKTTTTSPPKTIGSQNNNAQETSHPPKETQTTSVSQPKPVPVKEEPVVNKPAVKETETVSKPAVGSVKQNIFAKQEVEREEAKKEQVPAPSRVSIERKESGDKPAPSKPTVERKESGDNKPAPVTHSITKKNADFASNLNALLGGKVSKAEPIREAKPKEESSSQDTYTEALLAKPTTTTTKKKATLIFVDDDEDF